VSESVFAPSTVTFKCSVCHETTEVVVPYCMFPQLPKDWRRIVVAVDDGGEISRYSLPEYAHVYHVALAIHAAADRYVAVKKA